MVSPVTTCFRPDDRADVAGQHFGNFFALIGVHFHQTPDTLALALGDVINRFAGVQLARVHPDEAQLSDEWIGHDLENQGRKRLAVISMTLNVDLRIVDINTLDGRHVDRRREISAHSIQQILHALVLEGRSTDDRKYLLGESRLTDTGNQFRFRDGLTFDEFLEEHVIRFGNGFDQRITILLGLLQQILGDIDIVVLGAECLITPDTSLHPDQVHNAFELVFRTDRQLDRHRTRAQTIDDGLNGKKEVRADPVHLVDEADAGNTILVSLPPDRF